MTRLLILAAATAALAGCAHAKIAGTDIEDTSENHAIIDLMNKYREAVEAKDVPTLTSLLDPSFKDDGGTTSPDDDLDYQSAGAKLNERFAKLDNVKLDLDIRKIRIKDDIAGAVYHYNTRFVIHGSNGTKLTQSDSEIKEMEFKRVDGAWKITSGI